MTTQTSHDASLSALIIEVFRVNGLLLQAGDQLTQPFGLSSARWQVLGVVEHGPISVAHVARTMGLTRQSVQQTADGLEHDGFISYADNPFHRRSKLMQLTPKGHATLAALVERRSAWARQITAELAEEQLRAALQLLQQLHTRLEQSMPQLAEANT